MRGGVSARGAAIDASRRAKRERRLLKRIRAGKKAGHGPMTRALRPLARNGRRTAA